MVTLKNLPKEELFVSGHRLCAGCTEPIAVRMALKVAGPDTIVVNATGCLEVASTIYPYTSWKLPWVHVAFENVPAVASGIAAALKAMEKRGAWNKKVKLLAFGGDGATYDIGLQSLSGAMERGLDFLYICLNNEAYMNTGIQRSGATPHGSATTTSPAGRKVPGKPEWKKDLIGIAAAHRIPYAATASLSHWNDYMTKVQKGLAVDGPAVIDLLSPCPRGWRSDTAESINLSKLAVETTYWPLYEVENGVYKLNVKVPKPKPIEEYLKPQGRFQHLFLPENRGELEAIQRSVNENWNRILRLTGQIP
ncbi:MAG: thiamine pyrophosphate-dependent enzyme [Thermoplasmata archaeon]